MDKKRFFTTDWFSHNIEAITKSLTKSNFCKDSDINILEIGSWEGRSTTWFLDIFPYCHMTCIDTFLGGAEHQSFEQLKDIEGTFYKNMGIDVERVRVLKGASSLMLFEAGKPETFDIVYVDGSHASWDALTDIVMSFQLLKRGGLMIIDDYLGGCVNNLLETSPKPAVDAFMYIMHKQINIIHNGYQIHLVRIH